MASNRNLQKAARDALLCRERRGPTTYALELMQLADGRSPPRPQTRARGRPKRDRRHRPRAADGPRRRTHAAPTPAPSRRRRAGRHTDERAAAPTTHHDQPARPEPTADPPHAAPAPTARKAADRPPRPNPPPRPPDRHPAARDHAPTPGPTEPGNRRAQTGTGGREAGHAPAPRACRAEMRSRSSARLSGRASNGGWPAGPLALTRRNSAWLGGAGKAARGRRENGGK